MNKITLADISNPQELIARAKALSVEDFHLQPVDHAWHKITKARPAGGDGRADGRLSTVGK
jgi:hypothetical protein